MKSTDSTNQSQSRNADRALSSSVHYLLSAGFLAINLRLQPTGLILGSLNSLKCFFYLFKLEQSGNHTGINLCDFPSSALLHRSPTATTNNQRSSWLSGTPFVRVCASPNMKQTKSSHQLDGNKERERGSGQSLSLSISFLPQFASLVFGIRLPPQVRTFTEQLGNSFRSNGFVIQKTMRSVLINDLYSEIHRLKQEVYAATEKNGIYKPRHRYVSEEAEKKAMSKKIERMKLDYDSKHKSVLYSFCSCSEIIEHFILQKKLEETGHALYGLEDKHLKQMQPSKSRNL
ncbi:hypothetical protein DVH24_002774 [Malus domestica]|uniref:Uncharacterized protein n=1 Tax=Malus domestica TaxID=3750 RepID=A0A498K5N6_MALDO|nr:hypothetical protein DVH24_002774 [Malus domestica]